MIGLTLIRLLTLSPVVRQTHLTDFVSQTETLDVNFQSFHVFLSLRASIIFLTL